MAMGISMKKIPDNQWDDVLSAASRLQGLVSNAVLVGGTASAIFAAHRTSYDADHVVPNLKEEFDQILESLESVAGWQTARVKRPVIILGKLDGIETGIRQMIRSAPLETKEIYVRSQKIIVPTEAEILRIKGALILKRNATRDYLDFAALSKHLGTKETTEALKNFDTLYPQKNGESAIQQLYLQLANPRPFDLDGINLKEYKHLTDEWRDWNQIVAQCQQISSSITNQLGKSLSGQTLHEGLADDAQALSIEFRAQENRAAQREIVDDSAVYNTQLKIFVQAKSDQADRLVDSLSRHIATQADKVQIILKEKPGLLSSFWRGQAWQKSCSLAQRRMHDLEARLSRVKSIQRDTRSLEKLAEDRLRRSQKELARRRDAQLHAERVHLIKGQRERMEQQRQQSCKTGRGRSFARE